MPSEIFLLTELHFSAKLEELDEGENEYVEDEE
jgi:hypothetical protein